MVLTAEQQWMVAMAYKKTAADTMGIPAPQRAAFARKAKRFRTLARIAAKIEATVVIKQAPNLTPLKRGLDTGPRRPTWNGGRKLNTHPWQNGSKRREPLAVAASRESSGRGPKQKAPLAGGARV
jgi:hypothetical protein